MIRMRILCLGDIVGRPALKAVQHHLPMIKQQHHIDFVIAPAGSVSGGFGLYKPHAIALRRSGVDTLVGHDFLLSASPLLDELPKMPYLLRPMNYPSKTTPGFGWFVYNVANSSKKVGVICLQGQSMSQRSTPNNPFPLIRDKIAQLKEQCATVCVCMFGLATAEKQTMLQYCAGHASAVFGLGSRVMTNDATIRQGTATITDCGKVAARWSVGGFDARREIQRITLQRPMRSTECDQPISIQGVITNIDDQGKATAIELFHHYEN
jgi:calcineurin-like phosphoesterase